MDRIVWLVVVVAAAMCLLLAALSYWYWDGNSYWPNFLLNVVAEFVGMALTAAAGWIIAMRVTRKKLEKAIDFIARLRTKNTINGETARTAVEATVLIISPDLLRHARSAESNGQTPTKCRVCHLEVETVPGPPEHCTFCGLPGKFWKLPSGAQ